MTDLDLERLGNVWRQQPGPEELKELERTAEAVQKKARWGQRLDWATAAVVASVVIILVASSGRTATMLVGAAAILVLLFAQYRQRRLREEELRALAGPPEEMLGQSIARLETTLRHNRFSLVALGPAMLVGYLLAATAKSASILFGMPPAMRFGVLALLAVIGGVALIVTIRRQRRELDRLLAMRESYRAERSSIPR